MIIYDDHRFSCSVCQRGHRNMCCDHVNRILYEVRKIGRPKSIRQSKSFSGSKSFNGKQQNNNHPLDSDVRLHVELSNGTILVYYGVVTNLLSLKERLLELGDSKLTIELGKFSKDTAPTYYLARPINFKVIPANCDKATTSSSKKENNNSKSATNNGNLTNNTTTIFNNSNRWINPNSSTTGCINDLSCIVNGSRCMNNATQYSNDIPQCINGATYINSPSNSCSVVTAADLLVSQNSTPPSNSPQTSKNASSQVMPSPSNNTVQNRNGDIFYSHQPPPPTSSSQSTNNTYISSPNSNKGSPTSQQIQPRQQPQQQPLPQPIHLDCSSISQFTNHQQCNPYPQKVFYRVLPTRHEQQQPQPSHPSQSPHLHDHHQHQQQHLHLHLQQHHHLQQQTTPNNIQQQSSPSPYSAHSPSEQSHNIVSPSPVSPYATAAPNHQQSLYNGVGLYLNSPVFLPYSLHHHPDQSRRIKSVPSKTHFHDLFYTRHDHHLFSSNDSKPEPTYIIPPNAQ